MLLALALPHLLTPLSLAPVFLALPFSCQDDEAINYFVDHIPRVRQRYPDIDMYQFIQYPGAAKAQHCKAKQRPRESPPRV